MHRTAECFAKEADLHPQSFVVPPVEGFLLDWWCLFWDVYCARPNLRAAAQASSSQTIQNAGGMSLNTHPVLPLSRPVVNYAMQMPDFANLLPRVCPTTILRPDMGILLQNTVVSMMQSTIPRLGMRNMMLPRTEFNPLTAVSHISMLQLQTKTNLIAARMSEKMCLRPPIRGIHSNLNLRNANQVISIQPLSSSPLSQPEKKNNKKRKFTVTIDDNIGAGLRGSTCVRVNLPAPAPRPVQNNVEHADNGSSTSSNSARPNSTS